MIKTHNGPLDFLAAQLNQFERAANELYVFVLRHVISNRADEHRTTGVLSFATQYFQKGRSDNPND